VSIALSAEQTNDNDGQDYDKNGRRHGHDQDQVAQYKVQDFIFLVRQFTCWRNRSCNKSPVYDPFLVIYTGPAHEPAPKIKATLFVIILPPP